jgi:plastocyanin
MKSALQMLITFMIMLVVFIHANSYATKWVVTVQNFNFSPTNLPSVQFGDTIRWVWVNGSHTTTSLTIPPLALSWDHPLNSSNLFFEYVPAVAGLYNYKCTPHYPTMVGSFTVSQPAGFALNLKVFLEGPFGGVQMNANLNAEGILPLDQPYNSPPWNYNGTESVSLIPNGNVVDWVLIELRDAANASSATSATRIARQTAFLLRNGSVVGLDGSSPLQFGNSVSQQLFVIVWHRNHLGIMSSTGLILLGGVYAYDFSTSLGQAYGSGAGYKNISPGIYGMVSADSNRDGLINAADKIQWSSVAGSRGYLDTDYSEDSQVSNSDKNDKWLQNDGKSSQVPL